MAQADDFVKEFLIESREGLDHLDSDLVALEEDPGNAALFDSAFRSLHTLKGSAGFLDFHHIGELAHAGENVLQSLRSGEIALDAAITDALLELIDALRHILASIEQTGGEGTQRFELVQIKLQSLTHPSSAAAAEEQTIDAPLRPRPMDSAGDAGTPTTIFPAEKLGHLASMNRDSAGAEDEALIADFKEDLYEGDESAVQEQGGLTQDHIAAPVSVPAQSAKSPEKAKPSSGSEPAARESGGDTTDAGLSGSSLSVAVKHQSGKSASSSIVRVDVHLLDRLMNLVGELVLTRNQIVEIAGGLAERTLVNPIQQLNALTSELQDGVLKSRMQPIGSLWKRYPRMVRDFARLAGKEVVLEMSGQETELDKSLVEAITDPLIHLIRNAIDHGIEKPHVRSIKGKPKQGVIALTASHESGQVHLEITDDGAGIDLEKIRAKVVQRGLVSAEQAAAMADSDLQDSIFLAGFSTADEISRMSGRGVGLDVVKSHIERVGGAIEIDTQRDVGTSFRLTVPLTLAIIPALVVSSGGQRFAIPQSNVTELFSLRGDASPGIEYFHDTPVLRLRGEVLPAVFLADELEMASHPATTDIATHNVRDVVVLKTGTRQLALVVDEIGGFEEIVVKPLGGILEGMSEYAGATIMGDGRVALILNVHGLARRAGIFASDHSLLRIARTVKDEVDLPDETHLLVMRIGDQQRIAFPLHDVVRIEEIETQRVEFSRGREVLQYRHEILPLVRADRLLHGAAHLAAETDPAERLTVVIYNCQGTQVGIVVQKVIDSVATDEPIVPALMPGIVAGTIVVLNRITDVIDVARLVEAADVETLAVTESTKAFGRVATIHD